MLTPWMITPLAAGLSTGIYCLSTCFPFIVSCLVAEHRSLIKSAWVLFQFIAGRLAGYVLFGVFFGFLGEKINGLWIDMASDLAMVMLSVAMILYLCDLRRQTPETCCQKKRALPIAPLIMGFLMGINICPPFLLSLSYILTLHSTLKGLIYFVLFFLSSSVYFIPLIFTGPLSRMKEFQTIARAGGFVSAAIFLIYGIYSIGHNLFWLAQS